MLAATFHSVCARLLREHAGAVRPHRRLHDLRPGRPAARDRARCSPTTAQARDPGGDRALRAARRAAELESAIALAKSRLLDPAALRAPQPLPRRRRSSPRSGAPPTPSSSAATRSPSTTCSCSPSRLLREHPHRLAHLRRRWRWLLVDEMQDTNEAQAALVHLLAGRDGNVTVVGDDDQAIYRFRCAEPRNILALRRALPAPPRGSCSAATSARARRSSPPPAPASPQPRAAPEGADRRARRRRAGHHARVRDATATRPHWAAGGWSPTRWPRARRPARSSCSPAPRSRLRPIQAALAAAGIPHRVLGSLGLYERAEVRDALAYLALLANPRDAQAFRRAVAGAAARRRHRHGRARRSPPPASATAAT